MESLNENQIKESVRSAYANVAKSNDKNISCGNPKSCCGVDSNPSEEYTKQLGYNEKELQSVPNGSDMGLGCGNPSGLADLKFGEIVLDLGCGGGFDCFLAAKKVGPTGQVIGVDMTPEMVSKARKNVATGNFTNVEIRLGEIEFLPVANQSIDVVISNCVINLSPNKLQVFREISRVLKPGGRLVVSDIVATAEIPNEIRNNTEMYSKCISGSVHVNKLKEILLLVGFSHVDIQIKEESRQYIKDWAPGSEAEKFVVSAIIKATL